MLIVGSINGIGHSLDSNAANFVALFSCVKTCQTVTLPWYDTYKMECWGAKGGDLPNTFAYPKGGAGGYVSGNLQGVSKNKIFYVYVGEQGYLNGMTRTFNGGGAAATGDDACASAGGATDIRLVSGGADWAKSNSIQTRIMVAGGGAGSERGSLAGVGGGLLSYSSNGVSANMASQTNGYRLGYGENADLGFTASGAGGGYWGGITGGVIGYTSSGVGLCSAGGSSFISGHNGCRAITSVTIRTRTIADNYTHNYVSEDYDDVTFSSNSVYTYGGVEYKFVNTKMIDGHGYAWTSSIGGLEQMPNPGGGYYASGVGHSGNGYAKITSL